MMTNTRINGLMILSMPAGLSDVQAGRQVDKKIGRLGLPEAGSRPKEGDEMNGICSPQLLINTHHMVN